MISSIQTSKCRSRSSHYLQLGVNHVIFCAQDENILLLMKVATHQLKRFSITTQSNFILLIEGKQIQDIV